jgi:hypothetical protein
MSNDRDMYEVWFRENNLEELDREVARLSTICRIRILDRGVVDRVLQGDESVCGADTPQAFAKLRSLLMMHFLVRQKMAEQFGQHHTADLESQVIERLRGVFPDMGTDWPPG